MPVVCWKCGNEFVAGNDSAICPSCGSLSTSSKPRPLSLDDAVQLPPVEKVLPRSRKRRGFPLTLVLVIVTLPVVAVGGFLLSRLLRTPTWREFAPPDGGCRVQLPAEPVQEPIAANPGSPVTLGGVNYVARFNSGLSASIGWQDIDAERVKLARTEDVLAAQRDFRASQMRGKVIREAAVKQDRIDGREVTFDLGDQVVVDRYLLVPDGPRPRLYIVSVSVPKKDAEGSTVRLVIDSFRLDR